jgi:hypothetical protein
MREHEATRRLVKSAPELWAQCSNPDTLASLFSESFGEIRITRLEPQSTVAWEGERVSGTVRLEPSGWGTRVTLTAKRVPDPALQPPPEIGQSLSEVAGSPASTARPPTRGGLIAQLGRWLGRRRRWLGSRRGWLGSPRLSQDGLRPAAAADPTALDAAVALGAGEALEAAAVDAAAALDAALDSLGQAHHRPHSRS